MSSSDSETATVVSRRASKRLKRNDIDVIAEYPLRFSIVSEDGGNIGDRYEVDNILRDDASVYCSRSRQNINILLKFNDSLYQNSPMDSACVICRTIIKSPVRGFTAPCSEGMIFVSQHPISIEATTPFDNFTRADYEAFHSGDRVVSLAAPPYEVDYWPPDKDAYHPAAWFRLEKKTDYRCEVEIGGRSGRFVLIKLLRSDGESNNIDLQYVGFIGYSGPRGFANGTLI